MGATAAYNSTIYLTSQPSVALTDEAMSSSDLTTFTITDQTKRFLDRATATVVQAQYDEVQSITITGSPTGGTFTLTFGAQTTSTIAFNASASTVQTRLQALSSIGTGNALVTGSVGGPYVVQFSGTLAKIAESLITASGAGLTGGTSPGVSIARLQGGATWTTISSGFTLYRCNARVVFAVAQQPGAQVRLHSGAYFVVATLAEASSADFSAKMDMDETTVFNTAGAKSYIPTALTGTLKLNTFWASIVRTQSLQARDLIAASFTLSTGNHYDGFAYASDLGIKFDPKKAIAQDITLQITDEFFTA
jgi:hypothetical protein